MKAKPIVRNSFSTQHTSFKINFDFTNNITILTGDSGTGKTAICSFMRECMAFDASIVCLDITNYKMDICDFLKKTDGKLVVIDNADILLDDETRKYISLDGKNQYLIIGRNPRNLFATKENLFELEALKDGEVTEFRLKPYL